MSWRHILGLLSVFTLVALAAIACKPDFPNCDTDDHCQDSEEGQEQDLLYCVNGLCQQCRADEDCDAGYECAAGACEEIPGYCENTADCPGNQVCRDNDCGPECLDNAECDDGFVCEGGNCVEEEEDECTTDGDCPSGQVCQRNQCVEAPEARCELETVRFSYDSTDLSREARTTLQNNADCIQERNISVQIAGHCDERGTTEYNLALGERRANAVSDYLRSLGVSSSQISTTSYGDQRLERRCGETGADSCHQVNRRAEFNVR